MKKIPRALLELMADGDFHSGEKIGELLGISRAAVWKQLQKMEELQLPVESVKGKGYRLAQPLDFLDARQVSELSGLSLPVQVYDELDSTNAFLLRGLQDRRVEPGVCVLAESQSSGRGRRGRNWHSPYGRNVYFSLLWQFDRGMAALDGLSLLIGLSLLEALQDMELDLSLKWPNDVLSNKRKLAGVLLEASGETHGPCHVVIGVGINVNQPETMTTGIDQPWTSLLQLTGQYHNRNALVAKLLGSLSAKLPAFDRDGFAPFADSWRAVDAYAGREVVLTLGDREVFGVANGVSDNGELRLETASGVQHYNGGEVSLRLTL